MKKINNIFEKILILISCIYLIKFCIDNEFTRILLCLCVPVLVFLPKLLKLKLNDKLIFIYYLYIFLLLVLGSIVDLYSKLMYYDVFAHFIFGFLGSISGLYMLKKFGIYNKNITFNIIFIISLTLALSSIWEVFEYISSIIFNEDVQNVLTTGVRDTMEDVMASLVCSIIFSVIYCNNKDKIYSIIK